MAASFMILQLIFRQGLKTGSWQQNYCSRQQPSGAHGEAAYLVAGIDGGEACGVFGKLGADISGAGVDGLQRLPKLLHV